MLASLLIASSVFGQVAAANVRPQIGYVYPPGGKAGTTVEVMLGTYDWTPDMQVFAHDPRIKIEIIGPAGEPILTPPPSPEETGVPSGSVAAVWPPFQPTLRAPSCDP